MSFREGLEKGILIGPKIPQGNQGKPISYSKLKIGIPKPLQIRKNLTTSVEHIQNWIHK